MPSPPPTFKRPELLAPAGDWECARAAIENGADAIYFGLERFNARMRAKNFTQADLPGLMEFLHRRGVKGYVTFNTLIFTNELADAEDYLRTIIASGVDAANASLATALEIATAQQAKAWISRAEATRSQWSVQP